MKSNPGDMYILQDGTQAAPGDCSAGKDGVMRHQNGLKVLMDSEGNPMTVQKHAEEGGAAKAAEMGRNAAEDKDAGDDADEPKADGVASARESNRRAAEASPAARPENKPKAD